MTAPAGVRDAEVVPRVVQSLVPGRQCQLRVEGVRNRVEVGRLDPGRLEAPARRLLRQLPGRERHGALAVLAPAEPLLLGGGDGPPVDDERRSRVVEQGVDPEDAHACTSGSRRVPARDGPVACRGGCLRLKHLEETLPGAPAGQTRAEALLAVIAPGVRGFLPAYFLGLLLGGRRTRSAARR